MTMSNYVYLVEVRYDKALAMWTIERHVTNTVSASLVPKAFHTRLMAVSFARRYCRNLAAIQGTNLRLELQVYDKQTQQINVKDSYGSDPRATKG